MFSYVRIFGRLFFSPCSRTFTIPVSKPLLESLSKARDWFHDDGNEPIRAAGFFFFVAKVP